MSIFSRNDFARFLGRSGAQALRLLPPEAAHDLGMWMLGRGLMNHLPVPATEQILPGLRMDVPGLGELRHPIGLAAGFDKQLHCPAAFARMGFSFIEAGTVTPKPQDGNPKPRLFRQTEQLSLINRMGFNSDGATQVAARLGQLTWNHDAVPLGINIGKNRDTSEDNAADDFVTGVRTFQAGARYLVVNISSPNTVGLRALASREFLETFVGRLGASPRQIWVKLDPDMPRSQMQHMIEALCELQFGGVILTNTHKVNYPEGGGQSGHALALASTSCLEWAWHVHGGRLPMIASGGILSGGDILQKIRRGASAVQIYSALVYRGPWVV